MNRNHRPNIPTCLKKNKKHSNPALRSTYTHRHSAGASEASNPKNRRPPPNYRPTPSMQQYTLPTRESHVLPSTLSPPKGHWLAPARGTRPSAPTRAQGCARRAHTGGRYRQGRRARTDNFYESQPSPPLGLHCGGRGFSAPPRGLRGSSSLNFDIYHAPPPSPLRFCSSSWAIFLTGEL